MPRIDSNTIPTSTLPPATAGFSLALAREYRGFAAHRSLPWARWRRFWQARPNLPRCASQAARIIAAASLVTLSSACLLRQASREEHLQEVVYEVNDALRWGRMAVVRRHVAPSYLKAFEERYGGWGNAILLADMNLVTAGLEKGRDVGHSQVEFSWYGPTSTTLQTARVEQKWSHIKGKFYLVDDRVVAGPSPFPNVEAGNAPSRPSS